MVGLALEFSTNVRSFCVVIFVDFLVFERMVVSYEREPEEEGFLVSRIECASCTTEQIWCPLQIMNECNLLMRCFEVVKVEHYYVHAEYKQHSATGE